MQNARVKEYFLTEMQSVHRTKSNNSCRKYFSCQKPFAFEKQEHCHRTWNLEGRRVRSNNHNEGYGEENVNLVSRKKVKYDFDVNDTVRDFIKSILMRTLPLTVADDMGKNEMIKKALQAFGVTWNRQKAK